MTLGPKAFHTESEFLRWLGSVVPQPTGRGRLGIGDDAALVRAKPGHDLILTTDFLIEQVHFSRKLHLPRSVGHRALARSLSDIAAMGGVPRFALISLAIPPQTTRAWIQGFYDGLLALAGRFGVQVVGGDTAVVPGRTTIDVMVMGEARKGRSLRRAGARPGDHIFVSGTLGQSALGLRRLQSKFRLARARGGASPRPASGGTLGAAIRAHLYPEPRCALGRFLAARRLASALIDVSDGLSTDLARLCEASGVGARLWASRIPAPFAESRLLRGRPDPLALALHGGEDYELLFTVPPRKASLIPPQFQGVPLQHIGEIRRGKNLVLVEANGKVRPLEPEGYDHFRKSPA